MKFTIVILVILAPLTIANSLRSPKGSYDADVPPYISTLMDLYRGPPVQLTNRRANVETRWITQKLDNFDDNNEAVWYDRILINEDHFVDGSPIFIYLGGEWKIDAGSITSGLWVDIAQEHRGSLVYTEHRFFGDSIPITPLSTENLKYQSVEQALADVVNIIKVLKEEDKYKKSKVVVSGCSYSATMAVWLKKLYPDVIVGSWASSGPLNAKVDFKEYMKVVGKAYNDLGGKYCYNLIDNATSYYEGLFASGQADKAKKLLNLCSGFDENNKKDLWQIFSTIANVFAGIAQYQKPDTYDLPKYCSVLRSFSDDDAIALSKFVQWRLKNPKCVSARYQGTVDYYKWAMENYKGSMLPWIYQTCREFGWYQSSASKKQPFGQTFPATLYTDICQDVFGSDFSGDEIENYIRATNKKFGGVNPDVQNVYFTQGELDPWSKVGAGREQGAAIIQQASHCSDSGSISASDSPSLRAAKEELVELVREWLA